MPKKRIPVINKNASMSASGASVSNVGGVRVGRPDSKTAAGFVSSFGWNTAASVGNINTSMYRNSYANMGMTSGNCVDVPQYFAWMNQNNGGILYWPVTLKEKYEWYRYFARTDPFVKRAVEFHTDLPMSKLILRMPAMKDRNKRSMILRKYENMMNNIRLFERLHSILYELSVIGNAFVFCEFDEKKKEWSKLSILPPEEIIVSKYPMSDTSMIQYQPELLNTILRRYTLPVDSVDEYRKFVDGLTPAEKAVMEKIPFDFVKQITENDGVLIMDTDPFSGDEGHKVGSFVHHFCEKRHDYYDLGISPLECVLIPLLMKEHYKYTQLSLASRNMTPRSKICAPETTPEQLEDLRVQIDMSYQNPEYAIVTNYDWSWELIGAENRLIDLSREYESIEEQFYAGLSVTKEILTGEGMYSGSKINVELLNTKYVFKRELLSDFVEKKLFLPMAEENGFYEMDEWGNKTYFYPKLSFTRLTIRDNAEVFDSLFQLYQKGSLPVDVIYDLLGLDSDELHEKLKRDMFTVKDARYNDMLGRIYDNVADKISEDTDLEEQMVSYMSGPTGKAINMKSQEDEGDGGGYGFDEIPRFGGEDVQSAEKPPEENNLDISELYVNNALESQESAV